MRHTVSRLIFVLACLSLVFAAAQALQRPFNPFEWPDRQRPTLDELIDQGYVWPRDFLPPRPGLFYSLFPPSQWDGIIFGEIPMMGRHTLWRSPCVEDCDERFEYRSCAVNCDEPHYITPGHVWATTGWENYRPSSSKIPTIGRDGGMGGTGRFETPQAGYLPMGVDPKGDMQVLRVTVQNSVLATLTDDDKQWLTDTVRRIVREELDR